MSSSNAFITKLTAAGSTLAYSSYLGGSGGDDEGRGVAVDVLGNAYLAGFTNSTNFPTVNPEQASNAGGYDAFIAKLGAAPAPVFTGITPDTGSSSKDQITNSQHIKLLGTATAGATVNLYQRGVGLIGTTTADAGGNWTYDDTAATLPEGVTAFWATATVNGVSSAGSADFLVTVDLTPPKVTVTIPATTASLVPEVWVTASDLNGLPNGTTVTLDVDLNGDGNFSDPYETGYATGKLQNGRAFIYLSNSFALLQAGQSYAVQARVTDLAGNQGTSSSGNGGTGSGPASFQIVSQTYNQGQGPAWQPTSTVLSSDPGQGGAQGGSLGQMGDSSSPGGAPSTPGDTQDQLGNMQLTHPLDLDQSPGTQQGGNPMLVYNSDEVNVRPIVQVSLPSDNSQALPASIQAQLTFNGVAGATTTYQTSGFNPGDTIVLAQQASQVITQSGAYAWSMQFTINYATPITKTVSGVAYVVSEDGSPFGAGWTFSGTDQLIPIAQNGPIQAGVLRVYGSGGSRFYTSSGGNNYTSPTGDNGTLTGSSTSGWTYYTPDGQVVLFNSSGQETSWTSSDGQESLKYSWTGSQLTSMTAIDGTLTTFTYLSPSWYINPGNGRVYIGSLDGNGNLTTIDNPDGGLRTFRAYPDNPIRR